MPMSLAEKLRSVLGIYYDWVDVRESDGGGLTVRAGRRGLNKRDVDEFKARVCGEAGVACDVEVTVDEAQGEVVGMVRTGTGEVTDKSPEGPIGQVASGLAEGVRSGFWGESSVRNEAEFELSRASGSVPTRSARASVDCRDMEEARTKLLEVQGILEGWGFRLISEGVRDDLFIRPDGSAAWVSVVEVPGTQPRLGLEVHVPQSESGAGRILGYFGLANPMCESDREDESAILAGLKAAKKGLATLLDIHTAEDPIYKDLAGAADDVADSLSQKPFDADHATDVLKNVKDVIRPVWFKGGDPKFMGEFMAALNAALEAALGKVY